MIYFGIQLYETIITHKIFLFECFVLYVWMIWLMKWLTSRHYKKYTESPEGLSTSVIVPCLNEKPNLFRKCLHSIIQSHPDELIVVLDKLDKNENLAKIAHEYTDMVYRGTIAGKRQNLVDGLNMSTGDIIILADSDTIFLEDTIKNLIKPFTDERIGGVTTRQHIIDSHRNIISKFCNWMETIRFSINMPAQSVHGGVGCLPGRAIAFRREILVKNSNEFLNETFLGVKCNSGDDRFLTSRALRDGWNTVYQSDAVVFTDCPENFTELVNQQLRWARTSQRETLKSLGWLWKRPFTFFCFVTDIITPLFFAVVVINTAINWITHTSYFDIPIHSAIIMSLIGMNISLGVRQYPHLVNNHRDILYLPLYVLFMTFVMTPIRIWGLLTMRNKEWMTR